MIVGYDIGGGGHRPLDGEHLRVEDDGSFELWLLNEAPTVGRFAGHLDKPARTRLAKLAAGLPGPPDAGLPPGATAETWLAGDASLVVPAGRTPSGPWGLLVEAARALRPTMTAHPLAAIALEVADDWRSATLSHVGGEAIPLDPAAISVEVAAWTGYYDLVGTWAAEPGEAPVSGDEAGRPGWRLTIPLDHEFAPAPGSVLHVKVGVDALVGDRRVRLVPTVAPPMADPEA